MLLVQSFILSKSVGFGLCFASSDKVCLIKYSRVSSVEWAKHYNFMYILLLPVATHLCIFRSYGTTKMLLLLLLLPPPRRLYFRHCLSVCLLATLRRNFQTDLHEIFREGWQWVDEQLIKFWWRSGSPPGYRDCFPDSVLLWDRESLTALQLTSLRHRPTIAWLCCTQPRCTQYAVSFAHNIARLVRRGLTEVCTVPLLLVVVNISRVIFNLIMKAWHYTLFFASLNYKDVIYLCIQYTCTSECDVLQ